MLTPTLASEFEFLVGYKEYIVGRAWEDRKLDVLRNHLISLCDPGTFVREKRFLRFNMAGVEVKLMVGSMHGRANTKAAWEHCLERPLFHSLSLLVLDAISSDSSIAAEGVNQWVVFGLVATHMAVRYLDTASRPG